MIMKQAKESKTNHEIAKKEETKNAKSQMPTKVQKDQRKASFKDNEYMLYLNIYHKKYQQQMKTFKRRSFLPSELQKGEPGKPDKVMMMLKHICQYCKHDNKGEQIMRNNTFGRDKA